jgi:HK97 gp10 family phage protein
MSVTFTKNQAEIDKVNNGLEVALQIAVLEMVKDIQKITPRDKKRLPNNINRKDGQKPNRRGGVVNIGGNYYPQVTGSLKRSIGHQRLDKRNYLVGSAQGGKNSKTGEQTNAYGLFLEFGTKHMKPRSFVRKGILDNMSKINKIFSEELKKLTS